MTIQASRLPLSTLIDLVDGLAVHAEQAALVAFAARERRDWTYGHLARTVRELAGGLVAVGLEPGARAALFAPDGPEWIASALAVIRVGAVVVPLDAQLSDDALAHTLSDSAARCVFTTNDRAARVARLAPATRVILLDTPEGPASWCGLRDLVAPLPERGETESAALFYTSGTTGPPKGVLLSHRNLAFQINTLAGIHLVTAGDRVCLPLPLHHVYPFVVGLLTPFALGLPVVLPYALTGPQMVRALTEGDATVLVGVPRLYGALLSAMEQQLGTLGPTTRGAVRLALRLSTWMHRRLGLRGGTRLFRAIRTRLGPRLRLLTSGGAALEPSVAEKLSGLGWDVASGYGLTETSPLLTLSLPGSGHLDSAGRPIPGVELRIAASAGPERGEGEIQTRGPGVFTGYLNLSDKTRDAFTADGWFRTGDLGHLEGGFLYVTGRADEMLVTSGGENVNPENVEAAFLQHPFLHDFAVLQRNGRLVGLALPDVTKIEQAGRTDVTRAVREAVAEVNPALPSYQRLSDVAVTRDPLPRTRLGKLRRRGLQALYASADIVSEEPGRGGAIAIADMTEADRLLLEREPVRLAWEWLSERYPGRRLTMDVSLDLDLGVDSLEWLGLTLEIERRAGVELEESAITRVATIRDLLRVVGEAPRVGSVVPDTAWEDPERLLSPAQSRWLVPLGPILTLVSRSLMALNAGLMRFVFRLRTVGSGHLPDEPCVFTPNHVSFLDPLVLSAALGRRRLEQSYWGGWTGVAFANPFMRGLSRLWRVLPIDQERGAGASLALAAAALKRGHSLIWFPEGERSRSGQLLPFRAGVGLLLARFPRPIVPVALHGTFESLPRGRRWIRPVPVIVTFGTPRDPRQLAPAGMPPEEAARRIVQALQLAVAELKDRQA